MSASKLRKFESIAQLRGKRAKRDRKESKFVRNMVIILVAILTYRYDLWTYVNHQTIAKILEVGVFCGVILTPWMLYMYWKHR